MSSGVKVKNTIPESEVIREVKEVIRITGLKLQRINTGGFAIGEGRSKRFIKTADAGTLDFEGYDNRGRHVGIECKRPVGGRLSDAQAERNDDKNGKGGVALVVRSGVEAMELLKINKCI